MILKKENINKYKMKKEKKINSLNIDKEYKNLKEKSKEMNIKDFINDILFYLDDEKEKEIIKNYFKNYSYFKNSIIHILIDNENKEIIILRNNIEKKFFINSHIKFLLEKRKNNEKFIDIENKLNEILINKNFLIFDYLKYDIEEIK